MKILKEISKFVIIFILFALVGMTILTIVAKIPTSYVKDNLEGSVEFFKKNINEITITKEGRFDTYKHPYADRVILSIIYCLDTDTPLNSILEAKFYNSFETDFSNGSYIDMVENNKTGNMEYIRYWHGSIAIIKPLLMFLNINQIYIFNAISLGMITLIMLEMLRENKQYSIMIAVIIALIGISAVYIPVSFEYVWTFYIMLITSIIAIKIENKKKYKNKNNKLLMLFFIVGMTTCFFDFLTTEIITLLVPLIIVLSIRINNKGEWNFKEEVKFIVTAIILWLLGYSLMWIAKWVIAGLVLHIKPLKYVKDKAMIRINRNTKGIEYLKYGINAIRANLDILYPLILIQKNKIVSINTVINIILITVLGIVVSLLLLNIKNKKKLQYIILIIFLSIIPYGRYMILASHSYSHNFFTFRSQIATIMGLILIIINGINMNKVKKIGDTNGRKGTNNTITSIK